MILKMAKLDSAVSCEYGTKLLNFPKGEEFPDKLSDYQDPTPWIVLDVKDGLNK